MAGAGYKLFNTGDVLTAAQVNTYLMEQTVMAFADAAARTSALSGVLAEGMVSYLKDTNTLEVYDGSAWVGATGDITGLTAGTGISISSATGPVPTITNDVATEFDAKGDLVVGTGDNAFDRLPVGNSGETIVADSSASTGLRWQGNFAAGKNKIINGDFRINQRGFTTSTVEAYTFDRMLAQLTNGGGTVTFSAQTFTAGSAPVAGYEAINFLQILTAGQSGTDSRAQIATRIEDVRNFAGQTATFSFWAKAASGTPNVNIALRQHFGTGGSTAVWTPATPQAITTSWARYSFTINVPSVSGKTITSDSWLQVTAVVSAGSDNTAVLGAVGVQNNTFQIWGMQAEAGNTATAFQTATGTLAGELAACYRYYYRNTVPNNKPVNMGCSATTTYSNVVMRLPVTMRTAPSFASSTASNFGMVFSNTGIAASGVVQDHSQVDAIQLGVTTGTVTAGQGGFMYSRADGAYLEWSAEL